MIRVGFCLLLKTPFCSLFGASYSMVVGFLLCLDQEAVLSQKADMDEEFMQATEFG